MVHGGLICHNLKRPLVLPTLTPFPSDILFPLRGMKDER